MDYVYTGPDAVNRTDDILTLTSNLLQISTILCNLSMNVLTVYHNQSRTGHYSPSFRSFSIMGQSDPEYSEFGTVLADGGDRFGVSAICFDSQEELLWMGNEGVRIFLFSFTSVQCN